MIFYFRKLIKLPMLALLALVLSFSACQKEEENYIDATDEDTITANSVITDILIRTTQHEGSWDDIIDEMPCGSLVFPVTVIVNGQEIILQSQDDIQLVIDVFNQFPNDTDTLEIIFPITLELWDYTQITINSQSELNDVIANCMSNGQGNNEITCLEFVYPITIFTYNSQQEQTSVETINNDQELFQFLGNLEEDDYYSFDFPLTVLVDGVSQEVTSTQQLENIVLACDQQDDEPIDPTQFETDLTTGNWYVTYYFHEYDNTDYFSGYQFTFSSNGDAVAQNGSDTVLGEWDFSGGDTPELELDFGDDFPFDELDEDWEIIEATSEMIRLKYEDDEAVDYLTFERNPNASGSNEDLNMLIQYLTSSTWFVNLLDDSGDDKTCTFVDYEFTFETGGTVSAFSTSNTVVGYWTAQIDDGQLALILNFDSSGSNSVFADLNDDWDVLVSSNTAINLRDISGGGGGTDLLNFERNPYTGCSGSGVTAQDVRDILEDGQWFVSSFLDDGVDETSDFYNYVLTFSTGGNVTATNGSNTNYGTWSVNETSDGLEIVLDFGVSEPFESLNDDWDILEALTNKITLQHISGGGGGTNDLIFEKI